jgi:hypothetical protein
MTTSSVDLKSAVAQSIQVAADTLHVELADGRTLAVPVTWYPRLAHGSAAERAQWQLIGNGHGIHWPQLDEDISVEDLLAGRRSSETQASLQRWLGSRATDG